MSMQRESFGQWFRRGLLGTTFALAGAAVLGYLFYLALTATLDRII